MSRKATLCLLFLFSFAILLKQVYPTITTGDAAEFTVNAKTLGINHPAGYPLYSLSAKLFSLLPLGSPAYRINLLSAWATAASSALLFLTASIYTSFLPSLAVAAVLPFGLITSSQSIMAEVYSLNVFFFALLILLTLTVTRKKDLLLIAFLFGCALGNHYLILLALPIFLLVIMRQRHALNSRKIIQAACLGLIGLTTYCYLPLRAFQKPPINWGNPVSYNSLVKVLLRKEYQSLEFAYQASLSEKLRYLLHYLTLSWHEFSFIFFIMGLLGLFYLLREYREAGVFCFIEFILYSLGLIFLLHFPYRIQDTYRVAVYYLPSFYLLLFFSAFAMNKITRARATIIPILYLILVFSWYGRSLVKTRLNYLTYDYTKNLMASAPLNSQIVTEGDNETFPLLYFKYVEQRRTDLDVLNKFSGVLSNVKQLNRRHPIVYANQKNAPADYKAQGLLFVPDTTPLTGWQYFSERGFNAGYEKLDNFERELMAAYLIASGLNYSERNKDGRAAQIFHQAAGLGQEFAWVNNHCAVLLQNMRQKDAALKYFNQAISADPRYLEAYYNLGYLLRGMNDPGYTKTFAEYLKLSDGVESEQQYRQKVQKLLR